MGSTIAAGNTVNLAADNNVTLEASKNTYTQTGTNSSNGANLGVTFGGGAQNGFSIQLGITQGRGKENADDASYNNSRVSGGQAVNITSGGDLTLRGAVVEANRVTADVGGNLSIQSLQDTSTHSSKQNNSGLNLSLCIPPICYGVVATVGASAGGARANGNFVSVSEQSGIKAGDGGFDVNVAGNTNLVGAVIESTQAAIDNNKNSFQTGGQLTMADLQNFSNSSGSSYAVSGSVGLGYTTRDNPTPSWDPKPGQSAAPPSGSAGVGSVSGATQSSTTRSGISGIAGDDGVRTGDNSSAGALVKDWSTNSIMRDVQAQAQITQQFNQNVAREIGTYAAGQTRKYELAQGAAQSAETVLADPNTSVQDRVQAQAMLDAASLTIAAEQATYDQWKEGGASRVLAHTAAGALAGGVGGALGAGVSASLMPRIGDAIDQMGLPASVAGAVAAITAGAIGATVGGAAGAASAYSIDLNNRQLHPAERGQLRTEAQRVARQQIEGFDQLTPEQQASAESYWYNQLSAAALARVDDNGRAARDAYLASVAETRQPGLQGSFSSAQVLANAELANSIVDGLANQGTAILNMYGEPVQAGGQTLVAFNATAEQRANSYLLNTPSAEAERQQVASQNRATLEYLGAVNGGALRDYTLEEMLIGGAIGGRAVNAVVGFVDRAAAAAVNRAQIQELNNLLTGKGKIGQEIGAGDFKVVYEIEGNPSKVVAVSKTNSTSELQAEIKQLNQLSDAGVPVVKNYGLTVVEGRAGILMDRVPEGITVKPAFNAPGIEEIAFSRLNSNSLNDLQAIKNFLEKNTIGDFQVMISNNGRVLLSDPAGILAQPTTNRQVKSLIDDMIISASTKK